MKRNWIAKLIGGLSFTTAMFVFQACYGTPQDFGLDILIEGQVKSKTTGTPVKGIKVSVSEKMQYDFTNDQGKFSFYTESGDSLRINFEDTAPGQNGEFAAKDTVFSAADIKDNRIYLDIVLNPK